MPTYEGFCVYAGVGTKTKRTTIHVNTVGMSAAFVVVGVNVLACSCLRDCFAGCRHHRAVENL